MKEIQSKFTELGIDISIIKEVSYCIQQDSKENTLTELILAMEEDTNSGIEHFSQRDLQMCSDILNLGLDISINKFDDTDQFKGDR